MTTKATGTLWGVLWVAAVAVMAGGIWLTYHVQHDKVVNLQSQVASLQTQLKQTTKSQPVQVTAQPATTYTSGKGVKVAVYVPKSGAKVTSPLAVIGEVPGSWSFEASFPVMLKDSSGKVVAQGTATVLGDWMTSNLVPFSAKLTYTGTPTGSGTLVLQKDNPSGLAKNDDSVTIPVKF